MTSFAVTGVGEVRVDIQMGRVEVLAAARDDISVSVLPSNPRRAGDRSAAEAVRVERIGQTVVVTGPFRMNLFGPGDSIDVVVEVPEASVADVEVKYGSARLTGALGPVRAVVGYGDLTVDRAERLEVKGGHGEFRIGRVSGDADFTFKSGSARLTHVGGGLRIKGSDGPIVVDSVAGSVDAVTSSGSMEFGTLSSGATMRSAYGAVRVRDIVRGAVRVDGSYGSVDVGVRQGTAVWVDATAQHGVVRTDLAADAGPVEGEDTVELRIRTGYGSIAIHRSDTRASEEKS
ncbi:DUF4097 family beta strand repeat-containing protein [Microbacterium sp. P5_E9]